MAFFLRLECNFLNRYVMCLLPVEKVDIEVKVKTVQGIHMFWRDRTSQIIKCNPWSTRLHPYPIQKMKTYLELEGKLGPKPRPQPQTQLQPRTSSHFQNNNTMTRKAPGSKTNDKRRRTVLTKRRYRVRVIAQPTPATPTSTAPTPTVATTSTQTPMVKSTAASIPVMVQNWQKENLVKFLTQKGRPQKNASIHNSNPHHLKTYPRSKSEGPPLGLIQGQPLRTCSKQGKIGQFPLHLHQL